MRATGSAGGRILPALSHREVREGVSASAPKHVGGEQGVDSFPLGSLFLSSGVDTSELRGGREMTR